MITRSPAVPGRRCQATTPVTTRHVATRSAKMARREQANGRRRPEQERRRIGPYGSSPGNAGPAPGAATRRIARSRRRAGWCASPARLVSPLRPRCPLRGDALLVAGP